MSEIPPGKALFDLDNVFSVDDYLYVYQDDLTDERSDAEVAIWTKLLEMESPKTVLDLACGFGRHANRLASLGHSVTGVDFTPGFLDIARKEAERMGVEVDYLQGDMRQIDFEAEFDRVLLLFTGLGYFEDAENTRVLENTLRALKPGGLLGFDIPNRDVIARDYPLTHVIEKKDGLVINRLSFDVLSGRSTNRRIVIRHGARKDKPHSVRLYSSTEIQDILRRLGVNEIKIFGNDGQPLSMTSRVMLVVARKPYEPLTHIL